MMRFIVDILFNFMFDKYIKIYINKRLFE
jgi:hypothetical protein